MSDKSDYVLRLPDVIKRTGLSRSTIYKMTEDGNFPKQMRLGKRAVGWLNSLVDQWLQEQAKITKL